MFYLSIFFLTLYILLLIVIMIGLQKAIMKFEDVTASTDRFISVLVPFRNEEANLTRIIRALSDQNYKTFEVILINDHSEDDGLAIAQDLTRHNARFRVMNSNGVGKKQALTTGARESRGEIIVTIDADCSCGPGWIQEINQAFDKPMVKLAFGPVSLNDSSTVFSRLQWMEFLTITGLGFASYGLDHPFYCNGANLAFRRDVFEEVNGYTGNAHIPSGDDEFLLKKIQSKYPDGIRLINKIEALVTTKPQPTLRTFLHQRLRWAGKWKLTGDWLTGTAAVTMFIMQCMVIISWWLFLSDNGTNSTLFFPLAFKILIDYVFISTMTNTISRKTPLFVFLMLQVLYPFYIIYVGIFSNFKSFDWKGRRHSY